MNQEGRGSGFESGSGFLIGWDAGGGGGRCLVLDVSSGETTTAFRHWTHPVAPGTNSLGRDLDLDAIWAALVSATHEALDGAGATPDRVLGVAATSMRFSLVILGSDGGALYAGSNSDARAAHEALDLARTWAPALVSRTGHWISPILGLPRLQWAARVMGDGALDGAAAAISLADWLTWRLCGELVTDPSQAAGTGLLDLSTGSWATDLIEDHGLPQSLFPSLLHPGTKLGGLGEDAAASLSLRAGTPVAVGGADTQCGLLGAASVRAGDVGIVAGTTAPLQMVIDTPLLSADDGKLWREPFLAPGRWVLESNAGPMGESLDWFAHLLYPRAAAPLAQLFAEASESVAGARGLSSTLAGDVMNARELSVPVANLSLGSPLANGSRAEERRDIARAAAESAAFAMRANLEQIREVAGRDVGRVSLSGGLSRSDTLARIAASVLATSMHVAKSHEATAVGAALCAGIGAGVWEDIDAAARDAQRRLRIVEPHAGDRETYRDAYARWQELRAAQSEAVSVQRRHTLERMQSAFSRTGSSRGRSARPRILVTASLDEASLTALRALGEVEYASYRDAMRLLSGEALVAALTGFEVFVTEVDLVDARSMARLPDLRVVASCRGAAVNVDIEAAGALGIPVLHAPGRNADAVADLTLAFLLMLARKLPRASAFLRAEGGAAGDMGRMGRAFRELQGRELRGKTLGLVGLGAVGRAVARRLEGFGARVLAYDPFVSAEQAALVNCEAVALDTLLARSDFVSLHAPVTDATRGLVGAAELARMKPGSALVNTARAALVDEAALVDALETGHLAAAALDVFAVEPPAADHPLLRMEQVVATPHVGGNTAEVASHQGRIVVEDLSRMLHGEAPRHARNADVARSFDWQSPRPEPDAGLLEWLEARPAPTVTDLQPPPGGAATQSTPDPAAPAAPQETVARMKAILRDFCRALEADAALRARAGDKDVTLAFSLSDLGLRFWIRLRAGAVAAALGAPEGDVPVHLKLAAEVFDGMLTGSANPMQAAMDGRLSFTGDPGKAMALQELQADLSRLYSAARDAAGGPGDLSQPASGSAPAAPRAAAEGAMRAVHPARARSGDVRDEVCDIIDELFAQQIITATGGNVSARIPGCEELWITPSQLFKGDLRPEVLARIDLEGRALDEEARAPSSERLIHCAVYRSRPEANAVIHAHAPHATILANAELPFLPVSTEAAFFGEIPRVPFIMPGTEALAEAIGRAAQDSWAVLMVNHGLLVGGRSLRRAADMVEIVERSSQIILGCLQVGKQPPVLPEDAVAKLRKIGDLVA